MVLLSSVIRPVMEKVATIVTRHLATQPVEQLVLVGGACAYPGFAQVVTEVTGLPACVPEDPQLVTPLGIARQAGRQPA